LPEAVRQTVFDVHMSFDECTLNRIVMLDKSQESIIGPIVGIPTINLDEVEDAIAVEATIVCLRSSMHSDFRFPLCVIG